MPLQETILDFAIESVIFSIITIMYIMYSYLVGTFIQDNILWTSRFNVIIVGSVSLPLILFMLVLLGSPMAWFF